MLLKQFFESIERTGKNKTAVVGWGRGMGHRGHMMLASSVITKAQQINGDPYFVVSRTVGPDDPITPDEKLAIYRKVFPKQGHIFQAASDAIPDLTRVLSNLNQQGYTDAVVVVGADQVKAFQYLKNYNGKPDKSGNVAFNFNSLEVISRQETGDPSAGEEGPRATPMRNILMDPNATPEEQFRVWRDAMSPEVSDDEVRDLMAKAKERMIQLVKPKKKSKDKDVGENDNMSGGAFSSKPGLGFQTYATQTHAPQGTRLSEAMLPKSAFAGTEAPWNHKLGSAAQAKGKQKGPVRRGQLVGGSAQESIETIDVNAIHAENIKEHLLSNPKLFEDNDDYIELRKFLKRNSTEFPILDQSYIYASLQVVPTIKFISLSHFEKEHNLVKLDQNFAYFDIDGKIKKFPEDSTLGGDALSKIFFFSTRKEFDQFVTMLSLQFSEYKQKFRTLDSNDIEENLRKWFKEKWVRFGPDGKIKGDCARGDDSEGKPKCLPQSKAHALGKKGRASAAARKRREDPNPERKGSAINVATKKENTVNEEALASDLVRRIQHLLNTKFGANLDIDGVLGPLTKQSIKQFLPAKAKGPAPDPDKTTKVQGAKTKVNELDTATMVNYVPKAGATLKDLSPEKEKRRRASMTTAFNKIIKRPDGGKEIARYRAEKDREQSVDETQLDEKCWDTHKQIGMKKKGNRMVPNCVPKESADEKHQKCPHCGGPMFSEELMNEKKDSCYYKVRSRYKVWPSAYASGALVQCRKKGAKNWGTKSESTIPVNENTEKIIADLIDRIITNEAIQNNK